MTKESFFGPRGYKFKTTFLIFFFRNLDTKQLIDHSNFPTTLENMNNNKYDYVKSHNNQQRTFTIKLIRVKLAQLENANKTIQIEKKRGRHYELTLQLKKDKIKLPKQEIALLI
ncbi:unnamed protein product [Paramecium primaurelia]|uniref:Uncharacterized protein n=1 Tax=Paramecium primaurelia TaxID=5886 RepID=A0A8S1K3J0_PARPR|nr:unnamed protein product [Paramecium primaurelia]